ncbi:hypothetical protein C8J57DRAFT_1245624 [Mycena rebaudengoi]|nr:hypothetical protein C8J57DRAFT_1245624 [Mycena rebaudengoi]
MLRECHIKEMRGGKHAKKWRAGAGAGRYLPRAPCNPGHSTLEFSYQKGTNFSGKQSVARLKPQMGTDRSLSATMLAVGWLVSWLYGTIPLASLRETPAEISVAQINKDGGCTSPATWAGTPRHVRIHFTPFSLLFPPLTPTPPPLNFEHAPRLTSEFLARTADTVGTGISGQGSWWM